jgi:Mrp family chromosome partitioning ATPase
MELAFVMNALRRYWWIVLMLGALGALAGLMAGRQDTERYESTAVLLVSPPQDAGVQMSFAADPDRYVIGQLSVLRSEELVDLVADRTDLSPAVVRVSTNITHEPKTDIVQINVSSPEPALSTAIADAYVDEYFRAIEAQVSTTRQPQIDQLSEQLTSLETMISAIDNEIATTMERYLPSPGSAQFAQLPDIDMVAPDLMSRKEVLLAQYNGVLATRNELVRLDINERPRVTSQVVQSATTPLAPVEERGTMLMVAGALGGLFLGMIAAVLVGRLSRIALDVREIEAVLEESIVGEFPVVRTFAKNRRAPVEALPPRVAAFADMLAVRAEGHAPSSGAFTVAVVGTERSAGSTTLAGALANRFAMNGARVLLVDADTRDSELSRLFAAGRPGIPALIASGGDPGSGALSPTAVAGLLVVGTGDAVARRSLRRQSLPELISTASTQAHVVVFDCGPLLETASAVQLAHVADVVVLAVPERRLLTRTLVTIGNQLRDRRGGLLPVLMPARRRAERRPLPLQAPRVPLDQRDRRADVA